MWLFKKSKPKPKPKTFPLYKIEEEVTRIGSKFFVLEKKSFDYFERKAFNAEFFYSRITEGYSTFEEAEAYAKKRIKETEDKYVLKMVIHEL